MRNAADAGRLTGTIGAAVAQVDANAASLAGTIAVENNSLNFHIKDLREALIPDLFQNADSMEKFRDFLVDYHEKEEGELTSLRRDGLKEKYEHLYYKMQMHHFSREVIHPGIHRQED